MAERLSVSLDCPGPCAGLVKPIIVERTTNNKMMVECPACQHQWEIFVTVKATDAYQS